MPASRFGKKFETWKNGNLRCIKNGKKFKGRKCARKINKKFRPKLLELYKKLNPYPELNECLKNLNND